MKRTKKYLGISIWDGPWREDQSNCFGILEIRGLNKDYKVIRHCPYPNKFKLLGTDDKNYAIMILERGGRNDHKG